MQTFPMPYPMAKARGMRLSFLVNIFFHKSLMEGCLPFEMRQPKYNAETEAAMQEANDIASVKVPAKPQSERRKAPERLSPSEALSPELRPELSELIPIVRGSDPGGGGG